MVDIKDIKVSINGGNGVILHGNGGIGNIINKKVFCNKLPMESVMQVGVAVCLLRDGFGCVALNGDGDWDMDRNQRNAKVGRRLETTTVGRNKSDNLCLPDGGDGGFEIKAYYGGTPIHLSKANDIDAILNKIKRIMLYIKEDEDSVGVGCSRTKIKQIVLLTGLKVDNMRGEIVMRRERTGDKEIHMSLTNLKDYYEKVVIIEMDNVIKVVGNNITYRSINGKVCNNNKHHVDTINSIDMLDKYITLVSRSLRDDVDDPYNRSIDWCKVLGDKYLNGLIGRLGGIDRCVPSVTFACIDGGKWIILDGRHRCAGFHTLLDKNHKLHKKFMEACYYSLKNKNTSILDVVIMNLSYEAATVRIREMNNEQTEWSHYSKAVSKIDGGKKAVKYIRKFVAGQVPDIFNGDGAKLFFNTAAYICQSHMQCGLNDTDIVTIDGNGFCVKDERDCIKTYDELNIILESLKVRDKQGFLFRHRDIIIDSLKYLKNRKYKKYIHRMIDHLSEKIVVRSDTERCVKEANIDALKKHLTSFDDIFLYILSMVNAVVVLENIKCLELYLYELFCGAINHTFKQRGFKNQICKAVFSIESSNRVSVLFGCIFKYIKDESGNLSKKYIENT